MQKKPNITTPNSESIYLMFNALAINMVETLSKTIKAEFDVSSEPPLSGS